MPRPHNYAKTITNLVQSLEDFISVGDDLRRELLRRGEITIAEAKKDAEEAQFYVNMLESLRRASEVFS